MSDPKDESLINTMKTIIILAKKINKAIRGDTIPNSYEELKLMEKRLQDEEIKRNQMNRMRENIKHMIKQKKMRQRWIKLERRRKIRKFLHLPYKTLTEDEFFKEDEFL